MNAVEKLCAALVSPLGALARLPRAVLFALFVVAGALPYVLFPDAEFKSDDFVLIARGVETDVLDGLWRNLTRPMADTWTQEFYRPLFTWHFCIDAHLFGADPVPYHRLNLVLQGLAVGLGFLLLDRVLGRRGAAVLASLLFCVNPWAANNVSWLVGRCTLVATLSTFGVALLYLRYVAKGRRGLPWAAFVAGLLGIFYRETALFGVFLVFLIDLKEGRRDGRAWRDWVFLTVPLVLYLVARHAVLGTLVGGYGRLLEELYGVDAGIALGSRSLLWGAALLDLLAPGDGASLVFDQGALRIGAFVTLGALLLIGTTMRNLRSAAFWTFAAFTLAHGAALLLADPSVLGGNAQRWHTVMWALAGAFAAVAVGARWPGTATLLVVALGVLSGVRLVDNLVDNEGAAVYGREIRRAIREAPTDLVLVYNTKDYYGASAFHQIGLGQSTLPPFGDGRKAVYPISHDRRFGADETEQTPLAFWLWHRKIPFTAIWCDRTARTAAVIPEPYFAAGWKEVSTKPRLEVLAPAALTHRDVRELRVLVDARGLDRVDLHLVTPLTESVWSRRRGREYPNGGFRVTPEGERFDETLRYPLEYATFLSGGALGRAWLWIAGYSGDEVVGVSPFYELDVVLVNERPRR